MRKNNLTAFLIFVSILLTAPSLHSGYTVKELTINNTYYKIYGQFDANDYQSLDSFNQLFEKYSYCYFEKFNLKRPAWFTINIFMGAWVFKDLAGFDVKTAGLYDPESNMFFFQRPGSMLAGNKADRIIQHEMLHCVIDTAREQKKGTGCNPGQENLWLEESFCEAFFPTDISAAGNASLKEIKTLPLNDFKTLINKNIKSKNIKAKYQAYSLAGAWGRFLLKTIGEKRFFSMLTKGPNMSSFDGLYKKFRQGP